MVDFYNYCTNGNRIKYSLGELQNVQVYHNCVSTLREKILKTHKTAHFDTNGQCIYARQLYRLVLLRARISYGNSVCLSVRPSVTTRFGFNAS